MGHVDVERVTRVFREALVSFLSRRKSPLTSQMFTDLFNRFPVSPHSSNLNPGQAAAVTDGCGSCPGFVCGPVGYSCAAHHIWSKRPSAGKSHHFSQRNERKWIKKRRTLLDSINHVCFGPWIRVSQLWSSGNTVLHLFHVPLLKHTWFSSASAEAW